VLPEPRRRVWFGGPVAPAGVATVGDLAAALRVPLRVPLRLRAGPAP